MSAIQTNQIMHRLYRQMPRPQLFKILVSVLTVVMVFVGLFEFIPAWIFKNPPDQPHLWHIAELSALAVLLGGCMLGMIRRPQQRILLAQFVVLSTVLLAIGITPFFIGGAGLLLLTAVFIFVHPDRSALRRIGREGHLSYPLLGITAIFAIFLDPVIHQEIYYQIIGMSSNDVHAQHLHWIGSALLMILLLIAGIMVSTRRPGWQWLTTLIGLIYIFLGIIAIIIPDEAGSWAEWCGLMAIFGGMLYIFVMFIEMERSKLRKQVPAPASTLEEELYKVQQERQLASIHEGELIQL
jgi:hypothetical protein